MSAIIPTITVEEVDAPKWHDKGPIVVDNKISYEDETRKESSTKPNNQLVENGNLLSPNYLPEEVAKFAKMQQLYVDLAAQNNLNETLPKTFTVKYIGRCPTNGLWGIRCTRRPVQKLVDIKRAFLNGPLAVQNLEISQLGITITAAKQNKNPNYLEFCIPIRLVSYGVQDNVYQRIFAMITTKEIVSEKGGPSFQIFCFVCDSIETVHSLTRALAMAFKLFADADEVHEIASRSLNSKQFDTLDGYFNGGLALSEFSEA